MAAKRYIPGRRHSVDTDLICIAVRVAVTCMVFAYIVYAPLRCRYKHNVPVTCLLVLLLIAITVAVTILFLSSGRNYYKYSTFGILLWIFLAVLIFYLRRQVQPPGNPVSCACSTESLREYHGRGKGNGACTAPSLFLRAVKASLCGAGAYRFISPCSVACS